MFLQRLSSVVAIVCLSFSGIASAETTKNNFYIQVGADNRGFPIALDLASVKGTDYTLVQQHENGIAKRTLHAACSQRRLFSKRLSFYSANGQLTSEDRTEKEIFPKPKTADAASMEIVCRVASDRPNN
ncbi:hypothetical protein FD725_21040 [Nostoc sp. TCL26-01]|nr:hypothetical protein FD725_21040 [Nostoc sp. TCL26-01]